MWTSALVIRQYLQSAEHWAGRCRRSPGRCGHCPTRCPPQRHEGPASELYGPGADATQRLKTLPGDAEIGNLTV